MVDISILLDVFIFVLDKMPVQLMLMLKVFLCIAVKLSLHKIMDHLTFY